MAARWDHHVSVSKKVVNPGHVYATIVSDSKYDVFLDVAKKRRKRPHRDVGKNS